MLEIKTTHEIIKPCIEYKEIVFTNHWGNFKNKCWVSVDDLMNMINKARDNGNIPGSKGFSAALLLSDLIKELEK